MQFIREEYDPRPNLGLASYPAFDSEWDDGAGRIADAILADETLLMRKHADEIERLRAQLASARKALDWVESWVHNPVGSYSVAALDGLFAMTRDRIAELSLTDEKGQP
jgi:hypothetical protein